MRVRERFVAIARDATGLSTAPVKLRAPIRTDPLTGRSEPDPRPVRAYESLVVLLGERDPLRALVRVNGCALVVRGLLARLGIRISLRAPITEWGTARDEVLDAFAGAGALERDPKRFAAMLVPGNLLDLDSRSCGAGALRAHLAIALAVESLAAGAVAVRTLDGGQREPDALGSQCVRQKRVLFERAGVHDWRSAHGKLAGVGDLDKLAAAAGLDNGQSKP